VCSSDLQRNDLTIWEQAQGFQMMLDFGETVSDISAQTGFSETTVRRRVKLLDLDKDKFQKSVERGATLQEYAELDKIRDVELKNSVLEKMGTPNFQWELRNAIDKETKATNKALLIVELKKFATQIEKAASDMCHVRWFSNFLNLDTKYLKPDDADNRKYFFVVSHYEIQLLVKKASKTDNEPEKAIQEERRQLQEQRERLDELHKRAYELRSEFVKNYAGRQKDARNIMEFSLKAMLLGDVDPYDLPNEICKVLGIEIPEPEDDDDSDGDEIMVKAVFEAFEVSPEKVLLVAAYCGLEDERARYCDWQGRFASHSALDALYALLEKIGYEMSEEERSLRDGTHELYVCTEAKNEN
jgi:ParB family chromosome partitioning protein